MSQLTSNIHTPFMSSPNKDKLLSEFKLGDDSEIKLREPAKE